MLLDTVFLNPLEKNPNVQQYLKGKQRNKNTQPTYSWLSPDFLNITIEFT